MYAFCFIYFVALSSDAVILLQVPNDYFQYKGKKRTHKKALVLEYMETIPRHFSHYSLSSLHEYIDCALNWYKGSTDINEDGSISPCFLKWLDEKMGTTNYDFYQMYHYYDGVNCNRDYVHPGLVGKTLLYLQTHMLPTISFTVLLVSFP
jgi:hypothetical protein